MSNLISITFLLKCHVCHLRVFIHQNILSDLILQKYPKAFLFNDARVKSLKPRCACTRVVLWLNDPPQYEHKSGMIIPRYANTGEDCGSATHGTIRRHHSWGLLTPTSYNRIFLFYQNYNTRFSICQYLCTKNMADQPGIFFLQQNFPHFFKNCLCQCCMSFSCHMLLILFPRQCHIRCRQKCNASSFCDLFLSLIHI